MDWNTILISALSAVLSGGGIAGLVFFRENKRAKQLANETTASEQWRELYEKMESKHDKLSLKIDSLFKENSYLRDQNNNLTTQKAVLTMYKCSTLNCTNRQPPFGSQQNLKTNE